MARSRHESTQQQADAARTFHAWLAVGLCLAAIVSMALGDSALPLLILASVALLCWLLGVGRLPGMVLLGSGLGFLFVPASPLVGRSQPESCAVAVGFGALVGLVLAVLMEHGSRPCDERQPQPRGHEPEPHELPPELRFPD